MRARPIGFVALAVVALSAVGCGGDDSSGIPDADPASTSLSVTASASEGKADIRKMLKRYGRATEKYNKAGDPALLRPFMTDAQLERTTDNYQRYVGGQGKVVLGQVRMSDIHVRLHDTSRADVSLCLDGSRLFIVPRGTKQVDPGTDFKQLVKSISELSLVREGASWRIDNIVEEGKRC